MRHPGSVAVVAVDADDRVVLVRQHREAARRELLKLPAGGSSQGEEPPATAQRELREETGLHGGGWREFALLDIAGFSDERMHLFVADRPRGGRRRAQTTTRRSSSSACRRPISPAGSGRSRTRRRSRGCCSTCAAAGSESLA